MSKLVNIIEDGNERIIFRHKVNTPIAIVLMLHGAGAGNRSDFMLEYCEKLAQYNIEVISFNFNYMQEMYDTGKRRPPNPNKRLLEQLGIEIQNIDTKLPIFLAGKSMGGRVATQFCALFDIKQMPITANIKGCISLGYPFMPPGKPEKILDRTKHFSQLKVPLLINQGERDTFGGIKTLNTRENTTLLQHNMLQLLWVTSGDHGFKPLKSSGLTLQDNIDKVVINTMSFVQKIIKSNHGG